MKIAIRRMEVADVSRAVEIENRWSYLSKWGEKGYLSVMGDPRVYTGLVAEDGEAQGLQVVGLAVVAQLVDHCELCNLIVLPEYVSKGVGYQLLQHCIAATQVLRITRMLLEVRQSNQRAIDFYKRNGFRIMSERKNYYANPREHAWIMELTVDLESG